MNNYPNNEQRGDQHIDSHGGFAYVILSNDSERSEIACASWQEADRVCAKLNAETDEDTKFWVEAI